jgi:serine protease DegQ
LFAQTVTVGLAIWFVVMTLKPEWISGTSGRSAQIKIATGTVSINEAPANAPVQGSYRDAAVKAIPSVVNIYTTKKVRLNRNPMLDDPFFRKFFGDRPNSAQKLSSLGSGVIVSPDGFILTNNHVVAYADQIEVALVDGRKAPAKLVGTDPETDLAVIQIDLPNLPSVTLGRMEQVKVGDVVLAIGNPFGVGQTVTMGIISALGRTQLGINTFEDFIQTDAAINPGNSGGALIDVNGNLLGINSAIYSRTGGSLGIGFAIPVSTVKTVLEAIITHGYVVRGWIGVEPQDITPELAENFSLPKSEGVIIAGVLKNGPADKAGIQPGDVLVSIQDKPVANTSQLFNWIAQLKPGSQAKITVLRKDGEASLTVGIAARPKSQLESE